MRVALGHSCQAMDARDPLLDLWVKPGCLCRSRANEPPNVAVPLQLLEVEFSNWVKGGGVCGGGALMRMDFSGSG